jgi:hypothetical protein
MKKKKELRVYIGRKRIELDKDEQKKVLEIIDEKSGTKKIMKELEVRIKNMNTGHKQKLGIITSIKPDDLTSMRDFVILYLYTYHQLSSKEIHDNFGRLMTDKNANPVSRRTIHRIVTKYRLNRDFRIAFAIKRKKQMSYKGSNNIAMAK